MRARANTGPLAWTLALLGLGCTGPLEDDEDGTEITTQEVTTSASGNNEFGTLKVLSTDSAKGIDRNNPFFKSLGTNGRTCESCHKLDNALGISAANIKSIFDRSEGKDPIFRINDGSNAPIGVFAKTGTLDERKKSFSMVVNHGVIRVGLPVPAGADFTLVSVQDPYGFASAGELSLFRRPLPSVNAAFFSNVMWDGRESEGRPLPRDALIQQADDATTGHAQRATSLDLKTRQQIADFQITLFGAQITSKLAGSLTTPGCSGCEAPRGGPTALTNLLTVGSPGSEEQGAFPPFFIGINTNPGFRNISFTTFEAWESENLAEPSATVATASGGGSRDRDRDRDLNRHRGDIGDGENIFYTKTFETRPGIASFCTSCHNNPDVGNSATPRFFSIGIAEVDGNPLFTSDYPVYTFRSNVDGTQVRTTDPGLALRTGKFADMNKFKVPLLRGLGSRAPYFHNGQAKTLTEVVNFYNQRFNIGFTAEEIRKLVLFLQQT